jgi:hypothetical protein
LNKNKNNITKYDVGTFVLIKPERGRDDRLDTYYKGPFQIMERVDSHTYRILNHLLGRLEDFHISNIKPFKYMYDETNPYAVALKDSWTGDQFLVENIVDHNWPDNHKLEDIKFKVRWLNYSPDDDTWEPYSNIKKTEALHRYIRNCKKPNMLLLIPEELRSQEDIDMINHNTMKKNSKKR